MSEKAKKHQKTQTEVHVESHSEQHRPSVLLREDSRRGSSDVQSAPPSD